MLTVLFLQIKIHFLLEMLTLCYLYAFISALCLIIYSLLIPLFNEMIKITCNFNENILAINPIIILGVLMESLIILLFGYMLLRRIKSKNIIDLLYNRT